ncbi:MAG: APC family permease [Actinomycetia bacterium]|nr:APC family permease [Actinomycetes bacterium]
MAELRRALPLRTAVSTSAGLASAAINFLACVQVALYAGGSSGWLALIVAGVLITLSAANFAELNALYPTAAAIRVWIRRGLSDEASMVMSLVYMATVVFVIAADAFVLGHVFTAAVPGIPGLLWIVVLLAVVAGANLRGVKVAGWVQDVNAFLLLGSLVVVSALALGRVAPAAWAGVFHLGPDWVQAVALGVFIYVGFEWVTPLAEEVTDASAIPRGMFLALGLVAAAFGLFTLALELLVPVSRAAATLVPQLLLGERALGPVGFWWMAFVSLTTAMTTFNGGLVSASRFVYAAARERLLPPVLARLNDRFVPQWAVVVLFLGALVLAVAVYATGQYTLLIDTGAGVESLMYALAGLLVLNLRRREPDRPRSFRVPGRRLLPGASIVLFLGLGMASLTAETGLPGPVPWSLVFLLALVLLAGLYVRTVVPRLRARRTAMRPPAAQP